jgi:2-C-methyl-D-erythritol 4-phosphate cytidylyltransferase
MQKIVIIVAGGKGLRMGHELPKQFMLVGGKPILMHTLEAFQQVDLSIKITLVLPPSQQHYWSVICEKYNFTIPHTITDGGETRFHSVQNGLLAAAKKLSVDAIIGVHDGVRPFVSSKVIRSCYELAEQKGSVVPVIEVHETLRQISADSSFTVDRSAYRLVQTPQVFRSDILFKAYQQAFTSEFTDDASVVEAAGFSITLTDGNRENIKITTPFDLLIAEALLSSK